MINGRTGGYDRRGHLCRKKSGHLFHLQYDHGEYHQSFGHESLLIRRRTVGTTIPRREQFGLRSHAEKASRMLMNWDYIQRVEVDNHIRRMKGWGK